MGKWDPYTRMAIEANREIPEERNILWDKES